MNLTPDEVIDQVFENLPRAQTQQDICNCFIAGRFAWQIKEMGGIEHVQFAYRNNTPIVPPDHCGHPTQLLKKGFIDGYGWPNRPRVNVKTFKWPDGDHYYVTVEGQDVVMDGKQKWDTEAEALRAAAKFAQKRGLSLGLTS